MALEITETDLLMDRFVRGEAADEDIQRLRALLQEEPRQAHEVYARALYYQDMRLLFTRDLEERNEPQATRPFNRRLFLRHIIPAAAAATLISVAAWYWARSPKPTANTHAAVVRTIRGAHAEGCGPGTTTWEPLARDQAIEPGWTVRTGSDTALTLAYTDKTRIALAEDSILALAESPSAPGRHLLLRAGILDAVVTTRSRGRVMTIDTPHSRCMVRGTRVLGMVSREHTRWDVIEGTVDIGLPNRAEPTFRNVKRGQGVCLGAQIQPALVESGGSPFSPKYGGVFFKRYADLYGDRGRALDVLPVREGTALYTVDAAALIDALESDSPLRASPATHGGLPSLKIANRGATPRWARFAIPFPQEDAFTIEFSLGVALSRRGAKGQIHLGMGLKERVFTPPGLPEHARPVDARGGDGDASLPLTYRWRFLRVGAWPDGTPVYETRYLTRAEGGNWHKTTAGWLRAGDTLGLGIGLVQDEVVLIPSPAAPDRCGLVVRSLTVAEPANEFGRLKP